MTPAPERLLAALLAVVVLQRLAELWLARRNAAWARARGATEAGAGHYPLVVALHVGWLVAWPVEAWLRGPRLGTDWGFWLALFAAAQALRYWAIATLGRRWNTRILVLPNAPPIRRGPYRFMAHPNYAAVVAELAALPLAFGAWVTAAVATALNAVLLLRVRIPAESRALGTRPD